MKILKDHGIFLFKKLIFLVVFTEFVVWKNLGVECCCHRWAKLLDKCNKINSNFQIHFLYVGEGDSFVIKYYSQTEKKDFLFIVDAGEGISLIKKKTDVVQYIKSLMGKEEENKEEKITINGVILTHPHHDHYWNMKNVFTNFDVEKFFYYKKIEDYQNIKFEDYISSLQYKKRMEPFYSNEHGKKVFKNMVDKGRYDVLFDDGVLGICAIGPDRSHDNFNDDSIVLFISYKGLRFLLMGDAGVAAEKELIESWKDLSGGINIKEVDLIKIGHHGHHSSSCKEFVNFVKPKNVVNSTGPHLLACGLCNCHETPSVMRLWRDCRKEEEESVSILTTQEQGNIVAFVDESKGMASLKFCRN